MSLWKREQDVVVRPEPKVNRRLFRKRTVIVVFFGILAALFFFAFTGTNSPITGNVVGTEAPTNGEPLTGFAMTAQMGSLANPLQLKQEFAEIALTSNGVSNKIHIGRDNVLDLSDLSDVNVNIYDFSGTIAFDAEKITSLDGKVSKITINGIPSSSAEGKIDLRIDGEFPYNSLVLKDIHLKKYEFQDSGTVNFDEGAISLTLNGEPFTITGFTGDLTGNTEGLTLQGRVENAKIQGPYEFSLKK